MLQFMTKLELYHGGLGIFIAALALSHGIETTINADRIHPFSSYGWLNEQYGISFTLFLIGTSIFGSLWRKPRPSAFDYIILSTARAVVSMTIFMRYFWPSLALVAILSSVETTYACFKLTRINKLPHTILTLSGAAMALLISIFVAAGFLGVGIQ